MVSDEIYINLKSKLRKEGVKIKPRSQGLITRLMDLIPAWRRACTTIYKTIYTPKVWKDISIYQKINVLIHEYEHVKWNKWIIPMVLYLIGGIDFWMISSLILLTSLPNWIMLIFIPLAFTGWIFPHFRAFYEYAAWKKQSLKIKEIESQGAAELYIQSSKRYFAGPYYLFMGGLIWKLFINRLMQSVKKE